MATFSNPTALYYGSFEDTTTHTNAGITSSNLITFNTTSGSKGVSVVNNSKITFDNAGAYHFNLLAQFFFSGGASNYNITLWYAKNGQIVTNSAFTFTTTSAQSSQVLGNIEDILSVNAGDYIEFYWWSGASGMTISPTAAASNPTRPLSPSISLNMFNVGEQLI